MHQFLPDTVNRMSIWRYSNQCTCFTFSLNWKKNYLNSKVELMVASVKIISYLSGSNQIRRALIKQNHSKKSHKQAFHNTWVKESCREISAYWKKYRPLIQCRKYATVIPTDVKLLNQSNAVKQQRQQEMNQGLQKEVHQTGHLS